MKARPNRRKSGVASLQARSQKGAERRREFQTNPSDKLCAFFLTSPPFKPLLASLVDLAGAGVDARWFGVMRRSHPGRPSSHSSPSPARNRAIQMRLAGVISSLTSSFERIGSMFFQALTPPGRDDRDCPRVNALRGKQLPSGRICVIDC